MNLSKQLQDFMNYEMEKSCTNSYGLGNIVLELRRVNISSTYTEHFNLRFDFHTLTLLSLKISYKNYNKDFNGEDVFTIIPFMNEIYSILFDCGFGHYEKHIIKRLNRDNF